MALIGINPTQRTPSKAETGNTLFDRITKGIDVATKVLGVGADAYLKYQNLQEAKTENKLKETQTETDFAKSFRPAAPGEVGEKIKGREGEYVKRPDELANLFKQTQIENLTTNIAKTKRDLAQPVLTPGQIDADKEFGKDYQNYAAQGGFSNVQKQISELDSAIEAVQSGKVKTGGVSAFAPGVIQEAINPELVGVRDLVQNVVQGSLRQVLGAQYTEKEGRAILERAFNPRLPQEENIARIKRLQAQILEAAKAKEAAGKYFEQYGTLKGYQGPSVRQILGAPLTTANEKKAPQVDIRQQIQQRPKTINQNGHTYYLNEQTGAYE